MKLVHATTVPSTLTFLSTQPAHLATHGIEVTLISSPGDELERIAAAEGVQSIPLDMNRRISLLADFSALKQLVRILREVKPDIVHAHTPKAGLLAILAGRIARVPLCIYQIHGLRYVTTTGLRRVVLKAAERLTSTAAHEVLCVSDSVLELAENDRVIRRGKGDVIGSGTINGVDITQFDPIAARGEGSALRAEIGIDAGAPVIGFVGRLAADKGVAELAAAWSRIRRIVPAAHLVMVGEDEPNDPVDPESLSLLQQDPQVHLLGFRTDMRACYAAMSVLVLPSAREGFPQSLLEGSAMGLATVGSDVPGVRDAIVDGVTGMLYQVQDDEALSKRLLELLQDQARCKAMGAAGRDRAAAEFDRRTVRENFLRHYLRSAAERGVPIPASRPSTGHRIAV